MSPGPSHREVAEWRIKSAEGAVDVGFYQKATALAGIAQAHAELAKADSLQAIADSLGRIEFNTEVRGNVN